MGRTIRLLTLVVFSVIWVSSVASARSLTVRGSVTLQSCTAVDAAGVIAYTSATGVFTTVNLNNPDAPLTMGTAATGAGAIRQIVAAYPYAYAAGDANGLVIMDIYSATAPALITRYQVNSAVKSIAVHDTLVALATPSFVVLVGVRDRAHPHLKATYGRAATAIEFDATGHTLYCGSTTGAFSVNVIGPTGSDSSYSLTLGNTYGTDGLSPMTTVNTYADYARGAAMAVVSQSSMGFLAQYTAPATIRGLDGYNDYAFLAASGGTIQWLTQERNGLPELMAAATITGEPTGITAVRNTNTRLAIVSHAAGLTILSYDTSSAAEIEPVEAPVALELTNYPNPFNSTTDLQISVSRPGLFMLRVTDALGREIEQQTLRLSGTTVRRLNFSGKAAGVYFTSVQGASGTATRKLLYLP
jgi:hypothetical protein